MRTTFILLAACLLLGAAGAGAQTTERKDLQVFNDIERSVNRSPWLTVFDDISAAVKDGVVTLDGKVTQPFKRDDIVKRVAGVNGVSRVVDRITVLPVSTWDDQLRVRIARAIYGNPHFWNLGARSNPSIRIVVERGHVTLTGIVQNDMDRMIARSLVNQVGVFSVANELLTVAEARARLEQS